MILELLPEVQRLSAEEKRMLADELLEDADNGSEVTVSLDVLNLIDQRLSDYEANPGAVYSWADVRARVFDLHGA